MKLEASQGFLKDMKIMELGQYYHLYANYHVAAETLESWVPKSLELDLFEGKPILSWVASTWQDLKPFGLPWNVKEQSFFLTLKTYVKIKRENEWIRGYYVLESWMSGSKNRMMKRFLGLGRSDYLDIKRSVHFEPFEKSSKGVFEYKWSDFSGRGEQIMRFRTVGSPQPAMAGYLEYFTSEKSQVLVSANNKVVTYQEEKPPSMLWELDETVLPSHFPSDIFPGLDWGKPESVFVVKGAKVTVKKREENL